MADGDPVVLGVQNTSTSTTRLQRTGAAQIPAFTVANNNGDAIVGTGLAIGVGVHGHSVDAAGMFGFSIQRSGVHGDERGAQFGQAGVVGTSLESAGVYGRTRNAFGVFGEHLPTGLGTTPPAGVGVLGRAHPPASRGVIGFSRSGFGVGGVSSSGFAGVFDGSVFVRGNHTVTGSKSAAVPHPDGSLRALFAVESPQSWFEDFGRARLAGGRARVDLDADFAALVDTEDYHVFLTPEGECGGLFIGDRSSRSFEVQESGEAWHDVSFSYRVVARRRDLDLDRLPVVDPPAPVLPPDRVDVQGPAAEPPDIPAADRPRIPDEDAGQE